MKPVSRSFGFRRTLMRELAAALGLAVVSLAPAVASADVPPRAGSFDDVSYGDISPATFGGEVATAQGTEVSAQIAGSHDDVSYGDLRHPTFVAELQAPPLEPGRDDVTYPTASPRSDAQAVASTERVEAGRLALRGDANASGVDAPSPMQRK